MHHCTVLKERMLRRNTTSDMRVLGRGEGGVGGLGDGLGRQYSPDSPQLI